VKDKTIVFDFSKLKGRIIEKFGTLSKFAEVAHINRSALSSRLKNKTKWPPDDVIRVCDEDLLDIPPEQIHLYFFVLKF